MPRVRTTWNNEEIVKRASMPKQADPYLMNQDHVKVQPSAEKYVTGDPSTFGEDVNTDDRWKEETGKRNEIGMPEFRKDTFNHPEKTAGLNEAHLIKKADLATTVARMMLAGKKFADEKTAEQAVEDQAFNLMFLPDNALLDTHARLAAEQAEEQQAAEQEKQAGEMPEALKKHMEEKAEAKGESKDEQSQEKQAQDEQAQAQKQDEDPQAKEAALALASALKSGDQAKIASALSTQVKVALSIAKKAAMEQLVAQAQDMATQAGQMGEQMSAQAQSLVQAIQAGQSGQQMAQQAAQMAQSAATYAGQDPMKAVEAAKLAQQCAKLAQDCMSMDAQPTEQQVQAAIAPKAATQTLSAEQMQAAQQAQQDAMKAAEQAMQAAGQQQAPAQTQAQQAPEQQMQAQAPAQQQDVQAMDDMLLNDMMGGPAPADAGMDGLSLEPAPMDVGEIGLGPEDEVLTQLFTANQEAQDAQDAQQGGQDKQAHSLRTASMRTVGTRPTGGVSKIGGAAGAPAGTGDVNKLASLWQSAPDVRDAFGLPKS